MAENEEVIDSAGDPPSEPVLPVIDEKTIELLAGLGNKVESLEHELRGLQGRQDKAERTSSTLKNQLAEYDKLIKQGFEPDDAVAQIERGEQQKSVLQTLQEQVADLAKRLEGSGKPDNAKQEVVDAFSQFDLDLKDPRVVLEMQKSYKDKDQMELAAFKLAKQIGQSPNPNPAQDPANPGGKGQTVDYNKLAEEYNELSRTPTASGHMERMTEIQKDMQSLK